MVAMVRPWKAPEGDDVELSGWPFADLIFPRRLDRAFEGLGARIGEEDKIGEADLGQGVRPRSLGLRDFEKIAWCARSYAPDRPAAATRCGWAWPSVATAMPAPKSRYRSPSSRQPAALAPVERESARA